MGTESKKTVDSSQIAGSDEKYRMLFEKMDQGFCIIEILIDKNKKPNDYRFLETNPVFEQQTGLKDAVGKTARKLIPNLEQHWFDTYGQVALKRKPIRFIEGSKAMGRHFEVYAFPINKPSKRQIAVLFTDITKRQQREEQLAQSEAYYRHMTDNTPVMTWITDSQGRCTYLNKQWYDYTGQKSEDALGYGWLEAVHPDDAQSSGDVFMQANKQQVEFKLEYRLRAKDGTYRWHLDSGLPFHDAAGEFSGYMGAVTDIHERVQAEEALQVSQTKLSVVANNATTGLFMMDERQHCTFMNPSAEKLTGYTYKQISKLNKPLHDIIHHKKPDGSHYPMKECPIDRAFPERNRIPGEDVFVRPDGSFYPVAFMASPIYSAGKPVGTVIEVRDITDEKRTQDELRNLVAVTEQRNALIKLNKTKDEFISIASHQLRTPATGVKQYVNMVLDGYAGNISESQRQMLAKANQSNDRQLEVIDDLLNVANIDSGSFKIKKTKQDIVAVMQDILDAQQKVFAKKNQSITFKKPQKPVRLNFDAKNLRMAIENITDNASKYSPDNTTIEVQIKAVGKQVHIAITDKGVGIAKRDLNKLFKKFSRINNLKSLEVGGSGLGLYWAYKIVELHGGTIEVDSKLGKGTTFILSIPVK